MSAEKVQTIEAEYDEEGVYFYQAYNDMIASWAVEHQKLGGPDFKLDRMTWIKPNFAWMLYRSGYGRKVNQNRILRIKLSHETVAGLLSQCKCGHGGGGGSGRVQWDPARDINRAEDGEPRKMLRKRAIQIGLKGNIKDEYIENALSIEDVTDLAHRVEQVHKSKEIWENIRDLIPELPIERPYKPPLCSEEVLVNLGMWPGEVADKISRIGLGKTSVQSKNMIKY